MTPPWLPTFSEELGSTQALATSAPCPAEASCAASVSARAVKRRGLCQDHDHHVGKRPALVAQRNSQEQKRKNAHTI